MMEPGASKNDMLMPRMPISYDAQLLSNIILPLKIRWLNIIAGPLWKMEEDRRGRRRKRERKRRRKAAELCKSSHVHSHMGGERVK
jgi:hypothetical protein